MTSLGNFGTERAPVDLDFMFFGETIRAHPKAGSAALAEFMANAGEISIEDVARGAKFILDFLRQVIHPEDFDRFWSLAKEKRQDPMKDLMPIAEAIVEAITDFPTEPPAASVPGPGNGAPKSVVVSSLPDKDAADYALRKFRGRPDLQELVVKQEEAKLARARLLV
jgi:hypothetical protein